MSLDLKQHLPLLKEVQEIDKRIVQLEFELKTIPEQLEASGGEYLTLERAIEEKEGRLKAMTTERQDLEEALKKDAVFIQDREARLFAIKTQKEYQATLKEISEKKKDNKSRENRVLSLLEEGEKISSELTQLKSLAADKEGVFRQLEGELKAKEETFKNELVGMREKRPHLLKELPADILKRYDIVKGRYADALAPVAKGVCQGCHMNIPPQFFNEMLKAMDLRSCPHCKRLIFAEIK